MAFASLVVRIAGDITSLDKATRAATEKVRRFGSDLSAVGQSLTVGISLPLAAFGVAALKSAADIEALKLGLTAVTGSAAEAERQFQELKEVAKLPGLGLPEAIRGATNLQALGFSASKSKETLLQFGNALASVGRGREDLEEVIRQLGQMASRGKVTADNLKPIMERVPQVASIIRKEFGTIDTEVLQKMEVSAEQMTNVLLRELGRLPRVAGGLKNDFENMSDSVKLAMAEAGAAMAPFAKAVIDQMAVPAIGKLKELAAEFTKLSPATQSFTVGLGGVLIAGPLVVVALGTIIEKLVLLNTTLLASPVGIALLATGLGLAAVTARSLGEELEYMRQKMQAQSDTAAGKATKANTHFGTSLKDTKNYLLDYVQTLDPAATGTDKLGGAAGSAAAMLGEAAVEMKAFSNAVRGHTAESAVLKAMLSQLQSEYSGLAGRVADARLRQDELTAGVAAFHGEMSDGPPVISAVEAAIGDLQAAFPALAASISSMVDSGISDLARMIPTMEEIRAQFPTLAAEIEGTMDEVDKSMDKSTKAAKKGMKEVSTITTNLSQDIARMIVNWDSAGKTFVNIAKRMGESILANLIQRLITATGLVDKLTGALGTIFGAGGSAASGAVGAAGSVAGAAGSIGGGAASAGSAAASGIMGAINAIGSIGSMVSGIIGNFQSAGMNKSLDVIVQHTLQTTNIVRDTLITANQWWPWLKSNNDAIWAVRDAVLSVNGTRLAAAGAVTINIYETADAEETANAVVRNLKLRGVIA